MPYAIATEGQDGEKGWSRPGCDEVGDGGRRVLLGCLDDAPEEGPEAGRVRSRHLTELGGEHRADRATAAEASTNPDQNGRWVAASGFPGELV